MVKEDKNNNTKVALGTLYDFNKMIVEKELSLSEEKRNEKKKIIEEFIYSHKNNQYFMLLCAEKRDYTVFNLKTNYQPAAAAQCLVDECLLNRGEIRGIDITKDKQAIEIWLSIEKESFAYYFFPCDTAIIEF